MSRLKNLPKDFAAGHDKQLETGVQMVLDELKSHPIPAIPDSPVSQLPQE